MQKKPSPKKLTIFPFHSCMTKSRACKYNELYSKRVLVFKRIGPIEQEGMAVNNVQGDNYLYAKRRAHPRKLTK